MTDASKTTDLAKFEQLVTLAAQFKDAAEARLEDPRLRAKAIASLKPGEMELLQDKATALAFSGLSAAFRGVDENFLKLNLEAVDMVAELSGRVLPQSELAEYVPADLKTAKSVSALKAHGANHLAALCEYKPAP